jgi:hypothetical protein
MLAIVSALLGCLFSWFRPKHELVLENLDLRHPITCSGIGIQSTVLSPFASDRVSTTYSYQKEIKCQAFSTDTAHIMV